MASATLTGCSSAPVREAMLTGVKLFSSGTKEIRYTFKPGDTLQFACTLAGHYSPMHADIVVEG